MPNLPFGGSFDTSNHTSFDATSFENLSDVSPKDKPWDRHRKNADLVAQLYLEASIGDKADKMMLCACYLGFQLDLNGLLKLTSAWFCRLRDCPVCQWRRSLMWRARAFSCLPSLLRDYPKHRWLFLTLTVRNCEMDSLRSTISKMNKAFHRFSQRKFFVPVEGFIKTLEVTATYDCYLPNGGFVDRMGRKSIAKYEEDNHVKLRLEITDEVHPHFHILLFVPPSYFAGRHYISHDTFLQNWQECLGVDYRPSVHIKALPPHPLVYNSDGSLDCSSCQHLVNEVIKYQTKESDLSFDSSWLVNLSKQMRGVRAISLGGLLKTYFSGLDEEPDDLIHADKSPDSVQALSEARLFFGWSRDVYRYRRQRNLDSIPANLRHLAAGDSLS